MTDKTDIKALVGFAIHNNPQPLNITFPDGSQLNFPVSGKASFSGDVEESAKVFFDSVLRHRDAQLEAERQRADRNKVMQLAAEDVSASALRDWSSEGIKLHAANEEIKRLTAEISALKGEQVPVGYRNKFTGMIWNLEQQLGAETDPLVYEPVYLTALQKPASLPVGEIITWSGTNRHMGITREVDFRFIRFDVMPGTKLYAIESESAEKSDLLTRAEALAVETRALANQIQAGE